MDTSRAVEKSTEPDEITNSLAQMSFSLQRNPLLIDTVLHSLFRMVDYQTLIKCRSVCQKWKEISDGIFIKRSAFVLDDTSTRMHKTLFDIPTLFKSINQEDHEIRFSAFKFQMQLLTAPAKVMYFYPYKTTMTQLEITIDRNAEAGLNGLSNADHLIGPNLVKLKLNTLFDPWQVSLEKLATVQHIDMTYCKIVDSPGIKMAPKELKLERCFFHVEQISEIINEIPINQFIDFRLLQSLDLRYVTRYYLLGRRAPLILNFSNCDKIKNIFLSSIRIVLDGIISPEELTLENNRYIINGELIQNVLLSDYLHFNSCRKKLKITSDEKLDFQKKMEISDLEIRYFTTPLNKETIVGMNIKKLSLHLRFPYDRFNSPAVTEFSSIPIPKNIEVLELSNFEKYIYFLCSEPICFPKLKQIFLGRGCVGGIQNFRSCPSLVNVELNNTDGFELERFDVDFLPINTKALSLEGIFGAQVEGTKILNLNVLIFVFHSSEWNKVSYFAKSLSSKISSDLSVFHSCLREFPKTSYFNDMDVLKIIDLKKEMGHGKIAIGKVMWESEECFQNSILFSYVDKRSEYYLFDGQQGRGISQLEFSKMIPF